MESPACAGCRERDRLIADLRRRTSQLDARVKRLTRLLDKAQRDGKRQAAPFAKGPPKPEPKRPGRKPGPDYGPKAHRQPPAHIDEVHEAPLPEVCPDCGGPLDRSVRESPCRGARCCGWPGWRWSSALCW
jgi:transposase